MPRNRPPAIVHPALQYYGQMTQQLAKLSRGGRVVVALEGGYNVRATAECAAETLRVLLGDDAAPMQGHALAACRGGADTAPHKPL